LEPSWYIRANNEIVMVFRDQGGSFRKLAAFSRDLGKRWSAPVLTNIPDSRSKQSAGNLPNGTAFLIGNPSGNKSRYPLAILLSDDGQCFDRGYLLRGGEDLQRMRHPGRFKRAGFSYPKSVIHGDFLYVAYATNKEDIEITRVPLGAIGGIQGQEPPTR
jgi:predicted neuraminidase